MSKGEVGSGVPISHIGNMQTLFNKSLDKMNTSMTINAPSTMVTCSLHIATAEKQGVNKKLFYLEQPKMILLKNIYLEHISFHLNQV